MAKRSYAAPAAEEAPMNGSLQQSIEDRGKELETAPVSVAAEATPAPLTPDPAPVPSTVEIVAAPVEPGEPLWAVTFDGMTDIVPARNSGEAWSRVCDSRRQWPSPKKGKVERVEPLPAVP